MIATDHISISLLVFEQWRLQKKKFLFHLVERVLGAKRDGEKTTNGINKKTTDPRVTKNLRILYFWILKKKKKKKKLET